MPKKASLILVVALALILSVTTYAFAAANTVPATNAGDGAGDISGYTVSDVTYTLSDNTIPGVDFPIVPDDGDATNYASTVSVRIDSSDWVSCDVTGTDVSCTGLNVTALSAASLQVVAAQ